MANGILTNQLTNSTLGLRGQTPATRQGADPASTLHNQSSITNQPGINLVPSNLDLNGASPAKYSDNPPA